MDERMTILKMVETGKITAEQGAQLLNALGKSAEPPRSAAPFQESARLPLEQANDFPPEPSASSLVPDRLRGKHFHVLVTDSASGKNKVMVNLPMGLVFWGLKVGSKYSPEVAGVNIEELGALLDSGEDGKLVEVIDEEDGEHVVIYID
jgi:hypothetical protein